MKLETLAEEKSQMEHTLQKKKADLLKSKEELEKTKREAQNLIEILKRELKESERSATSLKDQVAEMTEEQKKQNLRFEATQRPVINEQFPEKWEQIISDLRKTIGMKEKENRDMKKLNEKLQESLLERQGVSTVQTCPEQIKLDDFKSRMLERELKKAKDALHKSEQMRLTQKNEKINLEMQVLKLKRELKENQISIPSTRKWEQVVSESL